MHTVDDISTRQRAMQEMVFRLALRDHGLTLTAIHLDSGLSYSTVQGYASGQTLMSIASLFKLVCVVPNELLSLLLPEGQRIVTVPEAVDHDAIDKLCREFADTKAAYHHPDSEAGRDIGPNEHADLSGKVTQLRVVAG